MQAQLGEYACVVHYDSRGVSGARKERLVSQYTAVSMLTTKGGDYALQGNSKREGTAPHQLPREMVVVGGREGMGGDGVEVNNVTIGMRKFEVL